MGFISTATETVVEGVIFPPEVQPPGSTKTLFLGGAGIRGLQIEDKFVKFTSIGVYLEESAVPFLQEKWKNKSEQELMESIEFFREIVTGPFEKFIRVTMILPLTGQQYSEKVSENCVAVWKSLGIYSEAEGKAVEKFKEAFKDQIFPPGTSILFTLFSESLIIGFTKDSCIPKEGSVRIENKLLAEAVLESIIGKNGVSPATRQTLSVHLSQLLKSDSQNPSKETDSEVSRAEVQNDGIPV